MKTEIQNDTKTKIKSEPMVTDYAMAAHFKPGHVILREGEIANRFYLIETVKVALRIERWTRELSNH